MDKSIEELIDKLNLIRARKVQREMERGKNKEDEVRSDYGVPGMKWKNHNSVTDINTGNVHKSLMKKPIGKPMTNPKIMTKSSLSAVSKGVGSQVGVRSGAQYSARGMTNSLHSGGAVTKYANGKAVASAKAVPMKMRGANGGGKSKVKTVTNQIKTNQNASVGSSDVKYNSNGTVSENANVSWLDKELGINKNGMANALNNMKSQNEQNETEQSSD